MTEATKQPAAPDQNTVVSLALKVSEVNIVLMGLAELKARQSMGVIQEIEKQANRFLQGLTSAGAEIAGGAAEMVGPPGALKPTAAAAKRGAKKK